MKSETKPQISNLPCWRVEECGGNDSACLYFDEDKPKVYCHKCKKTTLDEEVIEFSKNYFGSYNRKQNKRMMNQKENTPSQIFPLYGDYVSMGDRKIKKETLEKYKVMYLTDEETQEGIGYLFPGHTEEDGELVAQKLKYIKRNPKTGKKRMKWVGNPSSVNTLFGQHLFPSGGKTVTVTEGEEDAMALHQVLSDSGYKWPVVSLNNGAGGAEKELKKAYQYLNSFEKIIFAFDGDPQGQQAAETCADLFPSKVHLLRFTEASWKEVKNPITGKPEKKWSLKDSCDYLKEGLDKELISLWIRCEKYVPKGVRTMRSLWDDMTKEDTNITVPFPWEGVNKLLNGMVTGMMDVYKAYPKVGKCFGKDTPIRMFDGSVKLVQDIVEGDVLMGDDSTPRTVLSTVKGREELFEVIQSKRNNYVVNKSHILSLIKTGTEEKIDIPLEEYLGDSLKQKDRWKGYAAPITYEQDIDEFVPSYLLGVWLGDDSTNASIDKEVVEAFVEYYNENNSEDKAKDIFLEGLRNFNVIDNKQVPKQYILAPRKLRLELLAGLIDSAGCYFKTDTDEVGSFEITKKNEVLINGIIDLARSLGFSASKSRYEKRGMYYRTTINGNLSEIPTRVPRNQAISSETGRDVNPLINSIDVRSIGEGDYYGFVLDGNHRFLLEDFTVVHNTTIMTELAYQVYSTTDHSVGIIFLENTTKQIGLKFCGVHASKKYDLADTSSLDMSEVREVHDDLSKDERIVIFDPSGERTVENIMDKIMYFVKACDVRFIFLDHASMLAYSSGEGDERKFIDKLFADLKEKTSALNIYLAVVIHVNDDGKTRGSRAPVQLCDRLVSLKRDKMNLDPVIANTTEFIVEENRFGDCGLASKIFYDSDTGRMTELDLEQLEAQEEKYKFTEFDEDDEDD